MKISEACRGEACTVCCSIKNPSVLDPNFFGNETATHKIGEEILFDDPRNHAPHHNLTAYVCCAHFKNIFAVKECVHG